MSDLRDLNGGAVDFWLCTAALAHLYSEVHPTGGFSHPANTGDNVSQLYSPCNAFYAYQDSGAINAPQLYSDATRSSALRFGNNTSPNTPLKIRNSAHYFSYLHSTLSYTVAFWIRSFSNAATQNILESTDQANGHVGIALTLATNGRLTFKIWDGVTNPAFAFSITSPTITANGAWHYVILTCSGLGGTAILNVDGTTHNLTLPASLAATLSTPSTEDLMIGLSSGASANPMTSAISDLIIVPGVLSAGDQTAFIAYNPAPTLATLAREPGTNYALPSDGSHLHTWYKARTAVADGLLFQDGTGSSPGTTAVTSNGDNVGTLQSKAGNTRLNRAAITDGTINQVYATSGLNGTPTVNFAGDATHPTNLLFPFSWPPGDFTLIFVARNEAASDFSDCLWSNGSSYFGITGSVYSGNANQSYAHLLSAGTSQSCVVTLQDGPELFNFICVTKNNGQLKIRCKGRLGGPDLADQEQVITLTADQSFCMAQLGSGRSHPINGQFAELAYFTVAHSDAFVDSVCRQIALDLGLHYLVPTLQSSQNGNMQELTGSLAG